MHLTVKDIADLLNVSEKTIYRMIRNETIPCFRVGGQWRFDRREITSWIEDTRQFSSRTAIRESGPEDEEGISIAEFLHRGGIHCRVPGRTKEDAIRAGLAAVGEAVPRLDTDKLFLSILEREALCPTALGSGVAVPHPRAFKKFTPISYLALCFLETVIPFGALDNEDVGTLFFIFPKSERRFLRIQAKLLRLLREDEILSALKRHAPPEELFALFARKEAELFGTKP